MTSIAIYGATGSLGRQIARRLVEQGVFVHLGARDARRLDELARDLGAAATLRQVSLDDATGLREFLSDCAVVVNAGPTASDAEHRLARAALDTKTHYIDVSGSQLYIRRLFEQYSAMADRRGVAIAPAFGFDYALGDCLAHLAGERAAPVAELVVAYAIDGPDVGGNSLQFAADTTGGGEVFYESGRWTPARLGIFKRTIEFPPPFGAQAVARYAAGEVVTVPRHLRVRNVTTVITTGSLVPHPALVPWFPYLRPAVALARRTPARHLLGLALRLRRVPPRPAGETETVGASRRFAIVADATGVSGSTWRGVVEGGDFHEVTVATLTCGTIALAAPGFSGRGVLPPANVVHPESLFRSLSPSGVTCRVECIGTTRPSP
jgi:short subunit dehydrogenase-like uncharacterized protein